MIEREIPEGVITDHEHEYRMAGRWRTGICDVCGVRIPRHLSYGKSLAEKLGGDPLDYVHAR